MLLEWLRSRVYVCCGKGTHSKRKRNSTRRRYRPLLSSLVFRYVVIFSDPFFCSYFHSLTIFCDNVCFLEKWLIFKVLCMYTSSFFTAKTFHHLITAFNIPPNLNPVDTTANATIAQASFHIGSLLYFTHAYSAFNCHVSSLDSLFPDKSVQVKVMSGRKEKAGLCPPSGDERTCSCKQTRVFILPRKRYRYLDLQHIQSASTTSNAPMSRSAVRTHAD